MGRGDMGRFQVFKLKNFSPFFLDDGKCIINIIQKQYFIYEVLPNSYKDEKSSSREG